MWLVQDVFFALFQVLLLMEVDIGDGGLRGRKGGVDEDREVRPRQSGLWVVDVSCNSVGRRWRYIELL